MREHIGKIRLLRLAKRRALRVGVYSAYICIIEVVASGALQAQRVAPAGVVARRIASPSLLTVRQSLSESHGVDRTRHAVIGAAIGAVVGVALGYHRGKAADAACSSECGGPRIATLVYPPLFGMYGGAIGAIVGYVFPI